MLDLCRMGHGIHALIQLCVKMKLPTCPPPPISITKDFVHNCHWKQIKNKGIIFISAYWPEPSRSWSYAYANAKTACDFILVGNSNVFPNCHRLRDNHVWKSYCTRLKSLTLKMKVKNVGDFDENWQANLSWQREYVCRNGCFYRSNHLFAVHNRTFREERTDERTNGLSCGAIPYRLANFFCKSPSTSIIISKTIFEKLK